jgi:micrococcal nuclease
VALTSIKFEQLPYASIELVGVSLRPMAQILQFRKPKSQSPKANSSRWTRFAIIPFCLTAVVAVGYAIPGIEAVSNAPSEREHVIGRTFEFCHNGNQSYCVVDGDTIRVAGDKVRIEGIDAPEIHDYKCDSELDRGLKAKYRLLALINESDFELVADGGADVDSYGRKLRHLQRNGLSLGNIMVSEGMARSYGGGRRSWC